MTRTELYHGELTIADGATLLHREPVFLSFDALFGPDVAYVAKWQEIATAFVDNLPQSRSSTARRMVIQSGARDQLFEMLRSADSTKGKH